MVGNWGVRAEKMRENGNDSDGWGEKEEIHLWIEKGLNKQREWQWKDGLYSMLGELTAGAELQLTDTMF